MHPACSSTRAGQGGSRTEGGEEGHLENKRSELTKKRVFLDVVFCRLKLQGILKLQQGNMKNLFVPLTVKLE